MQLRLLTMLSSVATLSRSFAPSISRTVCAPRARCLVARARMTAADTADVATPAGASADEVDLQSEFLSTLKWRGFLQQATDLEGLDKKLSEGRVVAYLGFDATASSLHVGSLLQIMLLRHFQQCGHKPIVLVGGGTTKVGDPSGKDASRQMLTDDSIADNIAGITRVFERFLTFGDGETDALLVNNDEWLSSLKYLDFLREYGQHFTINRMLSFESVKQRLARESPLSFLEFNYMILQERTAAPSPSLARRPRQPSARLAPSLHLPPSLGCCPPHVLALCATLAAR